MFDSIGREGSSNPATGFMPLCASMVVHAFIVGLMAVVPLFFIKGLPLEPLIYVSVPPLMPVFKIPAPLPPSNDKPMGQRSGGGTVFRTDIPPDGMSVPVRIPKGIPAPPEDDPVLVNMSGVGDPPVFGDPNPGPGIPWGTVRIMPPPLPEPPKRPVPVRVGTLEPSKLIRKVDPVYPELAKKGRISGTVRLEAVIDEEGNITRVTVLSGHKTLCNAAVDAVMQWKYTPTVQNGEPIPILAIINVVFKLR